MLSESWRTEGFDTADRQEAKHGSKSWRDTSGVNNMSPIHFAQERLTTRTDGSRLLCFLPHSTGHLCYDERVVYQLCCSSSLHCVHTNRCMRSINSIGTRPPKDHPSQKMRHSSLCLSKQTMARL